MKRKLPGQGKETLNKNKPGENKKARMPETPSLLPQQSQTPPSTALIPADLATRKKIAPSTLTPRITQEVLFACMAD